MPQSGSSSLRIGFVGSGVIAWAHALALRALIREGLVSAELSAVHDLDSEKAALFAERLHVDALGSAEEVAAACDAVWVCTTTAGHLPAVRAAAQHGRAIFCEKPLGRSLTEATAVVEAADAGGGPAQAGLVLRSAPVYRELARLVGSGELGRPMAATMRDDQFFPVQGHYASTWRKDREQAGSGTLLEHAIHDVDVSRMCFGDIGRVIALNRNFAGHEGIEDVASGILEFDSGLTVALVSAWHSLLARPSSRRMEVFFERGFVSFEDDFDGPITVQTDDGMKTYRCDPPPYVDELPLPEGRVGVGVRPYVEENRNFLDAVATGTSPGPSLEEALTTHRVVDAWYRSALSGGVPVPGPFR